MEQEMALDLREIFEIIKKRILIIAAITLSASVISGLLSFFVLKPVYEAKVSILIGKVPEGTNTQMQYNDVMMYQKLIKTYGEIAKSRLVAEKTIKSLNKNISPDDFIKTITVTPQADTQIMVLKAQSNDPSDAMNTINALSLSFIDESMRLYPTGNVQIIDGASLPDKPIKPRKMLNIAIAFFLGLMVSFGIVFVMEYMDNTIKTENDIEKYLDLPVIGIIPKHMDE